MPTSLARRALLAATLACTLPLALTQVQAQETPIKFQLDWRFEGPAALFLVPGDEGLLQGREAERQHRRRQRLGRHGDACCVGRLRHGLCGSRGADGVSRQQCVSTEQTGGGDDGLQQHARRGARAEEVGHQDPGRPERQEDGRTGVRRRPQGVPDLREGEQHFRRELDRDGPAAARNDAGARRHRRDHRVLVHVAAQPRGTRREGGRRGRAALPRVWREAVRQRRDRRRGVSEEEPRSRERLSARLHERRERRDRRPERRASPP